MPTYGPLRDSDAEEDAALRMCEELTERTDSTEVVRSRGSKVVAMFARSGIGRCEEEPQYEWRYYDMPIGNLPPTAY